MNFRTISMAATAVALLAVASCKDDDDVIEAPNEEELITTMRVDFQDSTETASLVFTDLDGPGGDAPVVTTQNLRANTTYAVSTMFLNELEQPAEDITFEVREEGLEHQVFFIANGVDLTTSYNDEDSEGRPIGLSTTIVTGDAGTGTLQVVLRHEPDKAGAGVSGGNIANANGESDIDVTFDVTIVE